MYCVYYVRKALKISALSVCHCVKSKCNITECVILCEKLCNVKACDTNHGCNRKDGTF